MGNGRVDDTVQWAAVTRAVTSATARPVGQGLTGQQRQDRLEQASGVRSSIAPDMAGCSVTSATDSGFRTPAASNSLALELDLAQYAAADGPCVAAGRDGQVVHSIKIMGEETRYSGFTAAAAGHGVRSSLSQPLFDTDRASALNLYAPTPSAFEPPHANAVATFLARCVSALLIPAPAQPSGPADRRRAADVEAATLNHDLVEQAREALSEEYHLDASRPTGR